MRPFILNLLLLSALSISSAGPLAAQSTSGTVAAPSGAPRRPLRLYEKNVTVDAADVPAMIEFYRRHEVPVLEALVEEGLLRGFHLLVRDAGGEHHLRYNIFASDWTALSGFRVAYAARIDRRASSAAMSMVKDDLNELWFGRGGHFLNESTAAVVLESSREIAYPNRRRWTADFITTGFPALERAMAEGVISNWMGFGREVGGPDTNKLLFWIEDPDQVDNATRVISGVLTTLDMTAEGAQRVRSHRDIVWRRVPRKETSAAGEP